MLEIAGKLEAAEEQAPKTAADQSPFGRANLALDQILAQNGIDVRHKAAAHQEEELAQREAVLTLAQDPTIYNSVLSLKTAEAQKIQAQYQAWQQQQAGRQIARSA